jgi:hypothetical protein
MKRRKMGTIRKIWSVESAEEGWKNSQFFHAATTFVMDAFLHGYLVIVNALSVIR